MKKLLIGLSAFLLFSPLHVFAAESGLSDTALGNTLPIWSCIPFAGMLLSIAIFPLIKEEWWENISPGSLPSGLCCSSFLLPSLLEGMSL